MRQLRKFIKNTDKFYGLADSGILSLFRFGGGILIARLGGPEVFAIYLLYVTTNVIFQLIPGARYLTPLLNRGTGACPTVYGALCNWAQRGVERTALGFFILGSLLLFALPSSLQTPLTNVGFLCAAVCLLLQNMARTRMQMEFRLCHALSSDFISCLIHLLVATSLWLLDWHILAAYWWGACLASAYGIIRMRSLINTLSDETSAEASKVLKEAQSDGRSMLRGSIANSACSRMQPYLLSSIASIETLAYFAVLWTLIGPIRLLTVALSNLLRPRLALYRNQSRCDEFTRTYRYSIFIISACGVSASAIALVYGQGITRVLFGADLQTAGQWLYLALAYAGLDALTSAQMIATQIRYVNGAELTARLRIQSAVIALVLFVPATLWFGLSGTLMSLITAELLYAFACLKRSQGLPENVNFTEQSKDSEKRHTEPVNVTAKSELAHS